MDFFFKNRCNLEVKYCILIGSNLYVSTRIIEHSIEVVFE